MGRPAQTPEGPRRRGVRGERHWKAKLTARQVQGIRRVCASGEATQREVARALGITEGAVSQIVRGLRWAWLED